MACVPEKRVAGDDSWCARKGGEPRLEELLDDPIMALLWRRDRLEPEAARAAVRALRTLIRGRAIAGGSGRPGLTMRPGEPKAAIPPSGSAAAQAIGVAGLSGANALHRRRPHPRGSADDVASGPAGGAVPVDSAGGSAAGARG